MKLQEIIKYLESQAPRILQENYDNSGLLVGDPDMEVNGALVSLDTTETVMSEALKSKCNLIISHHPLIFKGLKSLTGSNEIERIVAIAIKHDVAIYAIHTNLDNVHTGVNSILANKLGLKNCKILEPKSGLLKKLVTFCPVEHAGEVRMAIFNAGAGQIGNYDSCSFNLTGEGSFRGLDNTNPYVGEKGKLHFEKEIRIETVFPVYKQQQILSAMLRAHPYEEVAYDIYPIENKLDTVGAGMIGELEKPKEIKEYLNHVKKITGTPCIRHSSFVAEKIRKVAICGGAGAFLITQASRSGAQLFITGDIKYHDFFEGGNKMTIADIGHFESEQFVKELIVNQLKKKFPTFAVRFSETNTNSVNYL